MLQISEIYTFWLTLKVSSIIHRYVKKYLLYHIVKQVHMFIWVIFNKLYFIFFLIDFETKKCRTSLETVQLLYQFFCPNFYEENLRLAINFVKDFWWSKIYFHFPFLNFLVLVVPYLFLSSKIFRKSFYLYWKFPS